MLPNPTRRSSGRSSDWLLIDQSYHCLFIVIFCGRCLCIASHPPHLLAPLNAEPSAHEPHVSARELNLAPDNPGTALRRRKSVNHDTNCRPKWLYMYFRRTGLSERQGGSGQGRATPADAAAHASYRESSCMWLARSAASDSALLA
jgi:hypothetical protein